MIETALISVSNKEGIAEFAKELYKLGVEIISTGNTARILNENGVKAIQVSDFTKFPEMLDGRLKTLHPKVFGGILADRSKKEHMEKLKEHKINKIDLVVVNFYPFLETIKKSKDVNEAIENIDIGGPSLVRAAAKNHKDVLIVTDPKDYSSVIEAIKNNKVDDVLKRRLAIKAFSLTARYDVIISRYFVSNFSEELFPDIYNFTFKKIQDLRYGENPDQKAAFYKSYTIKETCVSKAKQLHGKELSYNNIMDANDAFELIKEFDEPAAAVIKHTNPSGVAAASKIEEAYKMAHESDPKSAFGSIVALNRPCNLETAKLMKPLFIELVICPRFESDALELLKQKKNIRLLETGEINKTAEKPHLRRVTGGLLVQTRQQRGISEKDLKVVTKRKPTKEELEGLMFAWKVNKHVKSNSIVLAKGKVTTGIGAGQMSRVDAAKLACMKSEGRCKGSVMSSDAFFPFRDGVDEAAEAGVTAIIQPGGSIRDQEVIKAADEHNMAMVFSGIRLFKH